MIDVTESRFNGLPWFEVWSDIGRRNHVLADGRFLETALIKAELILRREHDQVQALLSTARQRVKAADAGSPTY